MLPFVGGKTTEKSRKGEDELQLVVGEGNYWARKGWCSEGFISMLIVMTITSSQSRHAMGKGFWEEIVKDISTVEGGADLDHWKDLSKKRQSQRTERKIGGDSKDTKHHGIQDLLKRGTSRSFHGTAGGTQVGVCLL